jgi:hypothetical protein
MLIDLFVYEIIPIVLAKYLEFTDYILNNYISENVQFSPRYEHNVRLLYNENNHM